MALQPARPGAAGPVDGNCSNKSNINTNFVHSSDMRGSNTSNILSVHSRNMRGSNTSNTLSLRNSKSCFYSPVQKDAPVLPHTKTVVIILFT